MYVCLQNTEWKGGWKSNLGGRGNSLGYGMLRGTTRAHWDSSLSPPVLNSPPWELLLKMKMVPRRSRLGPISCPPDVHEQWTIRRSDLEILRAPLMEDRHIPERLAWHSQSKTWCLLCNKCVITLKKKGGLSKNIDLGEGISGVGIEATKGSGYEGRGWGLGNSWAVKTKRCQGIFK